MIPRELLNVIERSAESVTPGHPDKICDQIADGFVDLVLPQGKGCRMAAEVTGGHGKVFITGELKSLITFFDFKQRAELKVRQIYFDIAKQELGGVDLNMVAQSPDIAQGVDNGGAGDQGVMIGFATNETPEMLPLPFLLSRKVTNKLYQLALSGEVPWMKTDGKSVVVMRGDEVISLVIAIQHAESVSREQMEKDLNDSVILPIFGKRPNRVVINGTGKFVQGGFEADAGTTGRKLIIDNYGPELPIGGGAYSGKDPTKVDRSAAYMARYIAKNIVAHQIGGANRALVQLAYCIGVAEPEGVLAVTDTGKDVSAWVREHFNMRPRAIIEKLDLWRPIYQQVGAAGHYGIDHANPKNSELLKIWTWEQVEKNF